MTTTKLLALAAAAMLALACTNKAKNAAKGNGNGAKAKAEAAHCERIAIDSTMTLISIKDNAEPKYMPNSLFYGKEDSALVEALSPSGKVESSVSCFIIETQGKRALFDTGNGPARGGKLMERLEELGIAPDSIDYLLLTHLHNDHIGGMTRGDTAVFGRAEVYVAQKEYDYWVANGKADSPAAKAMRAYQGRLHRFEYSDALPLGIVPMAAPGHTPGHTAYQKGRLLIVGDLFHGLSLQLIDLRLCADYDMDRRRAIETRLKFSNYARDNGLLTAGMHYPGNGTSDLVRSKKIVGTIY